MTQGPYRGVEAVGSLRGHCCRTVRGTGAFRRPCHLPFPVCWKAGSAQLHFQMCIGVYISKRNGDKPTSPSRHPYAFWYQCLILGLHWIHRYPGHSEPPKIICSGDWSTQSCSKQGNARGTAVLQGTFLLGIPMDLHFKASLHPCLSKVPHPFTKKKSIYIRNFF